MKPCIYNMCMYIYIYIIRCLYVYSIYIYIYICMYMYLYTYLYMYIYIYLNICNIYIYVYVYVYDCICISQYIPGVKSGKHVLPLWKSQIAMENSPFFFTAHAINNGRFPVRGQCGMTHPGCVAADSVWILVSRGACVIALWDHESCFFSF